MVFKLYNFDIFSFWTLDVDELAALDESDSESESDEEVVDAEKSQVRLWCFIFT